MLLAPTKGMADHADAFREELVVGFSDMHVGDCLFKLAQKVRDKAPTLGSFYKPMDRRSLSYA